MKLKHKEKLNRPVLKTLTVSSFLLGISSALILYIESDYFKTATGSENVTPFFIIAYALTLILIFNWHHLINAFGQKNVFLGNLLLKTLMVLALAYLPANYWSLWFLVGYMILTVLSWLDLDILLEACSKDVKTGSIRGAYLTIMNAGYLIAPFIAGSLIQRSGFQATFLLASVILIGVWLFNFWKLKDFKGCAIENLGFLDLIRKVIVRKNVMRIYYVSFLLELFYALMIIYMPLHLLHLGFDWSELGKIFSIMLIPFVLLQYPAGILADRKYEERDLIIISLVIMAFFTTGIFFLNSTTLWIWAVVLFFTRVGASLIEILRDSYFYKRIDQRDVDVINFFRSVRSVAYILGLMLATPVVYFFQVRYVFPIIGIMMLTGIPVARRLVSSRVPPVQSKKNKRIKRK